MAELLFMDYVHMLITKANEVEITSRINQKEDAPCLAYN